MSAAPFELLLTTAAQAGPIRNLWPLYVQDVSAYDGQRPNRHGVLVEDDTVRSWEAGPGAPWWERPEHLFPYLVRVDGRAVGFHLIATGPYVPTPGVDFVVHEFFVARAHRGDGTAQRAAQRGIERHRGAWEVVTYPNAARPIAFWRRVLPLCATGPVTETEEDHPWGRKVVWRFANG